MFVEKIVNKNVMPGGQSRQQDAEVDQSVKTAERAGPAVGVRTTWAWSWSTILFIGYRW